MKLKLRKEVVAALGSQHGIRGGGFTDADKKSDEIKCYGATVYTDCYCVTVVCEIPETQTCPPIPNSATCPVTGGCSCGCATDTCQSAQNVCIVSQTCPIGIKTEACGI